jgi:hypothetical protein
MWIEPSHCPPESATASANGFGPHVLDHEQRDGRARLELLGEVLDVLVADEVVHLVDERVVRTEDVVVELVDLERGDGAVGVLGDEQQVDDADRARFDEVGEGGAISPLNPLSGNPTTNISMGPRLMVDSFRLLSGGTLPTTRGVIHFRCGPRTRAR